MSLDAATSNAVVDSMLIVVPHASIVVQSKHLSVTSTFVLVSSPFDVKLLLDGKTGDAYLEQLYDMFRSIIFATISQRHTFLQRGQLDRAFARHVWR
jgi:hypothetical protein